MLQRNVLGKAHHALKLLENVVNLPYLKILLPILTKQFAKDWKVKHQRLVFYILDDNKCIEVYDSCESATTEDECKKQSLWLAIYLDMILPKNVNGQEQHVQQNQENVLIIKQEKTQKKFVPY